MSDLLNSASLVMIPSGYAEDTVYSVVPSDGSGDMSFTRASNGTRVNSAGLVEVVAWNLVEQSNAFSTSPWLRNLTTLTSGQTNPNGMANAWKVEFSAGNAYLYIETIVVTGVVTFSAYLRADSTTTIGFNDGSLYPNSVTIGTTWQRYEFSFNVTGANTAIQFDNYFGVSPSNQAKTFYIWGAQLNIGSTAKPYFPTTDRLNVPRLTYQNGGGGCPSLLLEKQSTNLITWSEDFTNATYTKIGISANADTTNSPDGTQNADSILELAISGTHESWQRASMTAGQLYTQSSFLKSNGRNRVIMQIFDNSTQYASAIYDLSTGVVVASSGTATIQSMGNGWYRCTITGTSPATGLGYCVLGLCENTYTNSSVMPTYSGDTAKGVYWWGFQLEASSYATSYIPTTSSSATRVADGPLNLSTTQTLTNFTLFWDGLFFENDNNMFFGSASLAWYVDINGATGRVVLDLSSGRIYTGFNAGITINQRFKLAIKRSAGVVNAFVNGTKLTPNTQVTDTTSLTLSSITWSANSTYYPKMKVNEICAFQTALSDSDCQALTTI